MNHFRVIAPIAFLAILQLPMSAQSACGTSALGSLASPTAVFGGDLGFGSRLFAGTAAGVFSWDGSTWTQLGGNFSNSPSALPVSVDALTICDFGAGPQLYAAGRFSSPASNIAVWDGQSWSSLGTGITAGAVFPTSRQVLALEVFDDGNGKALYACGTFGIAGGIAVGNIARWNGQTWSAVGTFNVSCFNSNTGTVLPCRLSDMCVYNDGMGQYLVVCGNFGGAAPFLARWNGTVWLPFPTGGPSPEAGSSGVYAIEMFDAGDGPMLYAGGFFVNSGFARFNGTSWTHLSSGGFVTITEFKVFDDGTGPALYTNRGGLKWNGQAWVTTGAPAGKLAVFDDGGGASLCATAPATIVRWQCPSEPSVRLTQAAIAGGPFYVDNTNLVAGREYYNLFSTEICTAGVGLGPYLGLCASTPATYQFLVDQAGLPLEVLPIHFAAHTPFRIMGPFYAAPFTADVLCIGVSGGMIASVSSVARVTVN